MISPVDRFASHAFFFFESLFASRQYLPECCFRQLPAKMSLKPRDLP